MGDVLVRPLMELGSYAKFSGVPSGLQIFLVPFQSYNEMVKNYYICPVLFQCLI